MRRPSRTRRHYRQILVDLRTRRPRLYSLADDPPEAHDLAGEQPDQVAALRRVLARFERGRVRRRVEPLGTPSPAQVEQLRSLGYLR